MFLENCRTQKSHRFLKGTRWQFRTRGWDSAELDIGAISGKNFGTFPNKRIGRFRTRLSGRLRTSASGHSLYKNPGHFLKTVSRHIRAEMIDATCTRRPDRNGLKITAFPQTKTVCKYYDSIRRNALDGLPTAPNTQKVIG